MSSYILYTIPASLYSGKARSYMRKRHIDYVERAVGNPRFVEQLLPQLGRLIIPVLQAPDGTMIQDTVDIIDHFERSAPADVSAYPGTPTQRVVAHLLEMFGGEGLIRPAMHYRWNFDEVNLAFIREEIINGFAPGADADTRAQFFAFASGAMREATVAVGVTPDTIPAVERSYEEFLELLEAHFATAPYLLGGRPTIADYGFIAPLYAHLARDPYPSLMMKQRAVRVWRWVERMNSPVTDAGEYVDYPQELFADDAIPATLRALLAYIGKEHTGEMLAQVAFLDEWLAERDEIAEGDVLPYDVGDRFLGRVTFDWRGMPMTIGVHPYRLLMLQRLQDAFAAVSQDAQDELRTIFGESGLEALLDARPRRRMIRRANREAWGAPQGPVLAR
jgi:glutathione S-transferase